MLILKLAVVCSMAVGFAYLAYRLYVYIVPGQEHAGSAGAVKREKPHIALRIIFPFINIFDLF